jgi:hypothetical protein
MPSARNLRVNELFNRAQWQDSINRRAVVEQFVSTNFFNGGFCGLIILRIKKN